MQKYVYFFGGGKAEGKSNAFRSTSLGRRATMASRDSAAGAATDQLARRNRSTGAVDNETDGGHRLTGAD